MTRTIYRSARGRTVVRAWCERQHQGAELVPSEIASSLGTVSVTSLGKGPAVVLVPGTNFPTSTWLGLLTALARDHHVIGVDLPGQPGLSDPRRPRDRDAYAPWLGEVLRTLELDRPVVVGHSLGARIALLAASTGVPVGGLLLVNPAGLIRLRVTPRVLATTVRWLAWRDEPSSAALLRRMMAPGNPVPGRLAEWMAIVARYVRTSLAPPALSPDVLARIDGPVHLVTGAHDTFLPSRRLVRAFATFADPNDATVIATAGHILPEEEPQAVIRSVSAVAAAGTDR